MRSAGSKTVVLNRFAGGRGFVPGRNVRGLHVLTDREYVSMRTRLARLPHVRDRLAILRAETKDRQLSVLQVWEQLLPFAASDMRFDATSYLLSRLESPADGERVLALQTLYAKSRAAPKKKDPREWRLTGFGGSPPERPVVLTLREYLGEQKGDTFRTFSTGGSVLS